VTLIFGYSVTLDLIVSDINSHFALKIQYLSLYIPEALFNAIKTGPQIKGLVGFI